MKRIWHMAAKDLRLLVRDKAAAFFIFVFPILMGLFFGVMMGTPNRGGGSKMKIAIVDQDQSEFSEKFVEGLKQNDSIILEPMEFEAARESVRKGSRTGMIVINEGFGETAGVFWMPAPTIQVGVDPSRMAESAMIQGFVMEGMGGLVGERFQDTGSLRESVLQQQKEIAGDSELDPGNKLLLTALFGSVESLMDNLDALPNDETDSEGEASGGPNFNFANIESLDVTRKVDPKSIEGQVKKIRSQWDISFPQAMLWGVLGCVAGFAVSIAKETTEGTMVRLQASPVSTFEILLGKALACFLAVLMVIAMMTILGWLLGMRAGSYWHLLAAALSIAVCFVGIMMTMSVLGKTEQAVGGIGWAINMVMAMLGGAMIPVMFMPAVVKQFSVVSPVKWSILALEGSIWRDFSLMEMLLPCAVLVGFGVAGLLVGTAILNRRLS